MGGGFRWYRAAAVKGWGCKLSCSGCGTGRRTQACLVRVRVVRVCYHGWKRRIIGRQLGLPGMMSEGSCCVFACMMKGVVLVCVCVGSNWLATCSRHAQKKKIGQKLATPRIIAERERSERP